MAKRKKKRIASRGSVNNIILKSLIEGDKYGYEIIKDVETYSEGKIKLKQPSLYSSLSRFEDKGYVSSYWGDSDIGGRRHYYHLTDNGIAYYQRAVLKITDNDNEEIIEEDDEENVLTSDEINTDTPIEEKEVENVTEIIDENIHEDSSIIVTEIDENSIPAIVDFPDNSIENTDEDNVEQIADHHFYETTPMEKSIFDNIPVVKATPVVSPSPWAELASSVKLNNKRISSSPNRRFHYIIPKKEKKVILDKDGIYKLRDADYVSSEHREAKPKIIDNVIKRTKDNNIYGYSSYTDIKENKNDSAIAELSDEEKRRRNDIFVAKFNSLTQAKYEDNERTKDYQSKLNLFMETEEEPQPIQEEKPIQTSIPRIYQYSNENNSSDNNLFNYEEVDEPIDNQLTDNFIEDSEDKFIDFDPEEFETKNENKQYIQEIANYTAPTENVKVSRYVNNSNAVLQDKSYVLINKVNCIFGFILAILLFAELTVALFVFKNYNLIQDGDNTLFIVAFVSVTLLALCYILPICFNPNEHKLNNFKLKYAMLFGILTFLVCTILVYCFNALFGFQLDNIEFYAVKLVIPTLLAFNFVILPPIYSKLINCKKFYD